MEGLGSLLLSESDRSTCHQHVRSVSLPSRIHPVSVKLGAALERLSFWRMSSSSAAIAASFGSETLHVGLINLTELYGCVHELLQSPHVQDTLLRHHEGKLLEDSLDTSVVLLDTCEAVRNILEAMRDRAQILQSGLRRKGPSPSAERDVNAYVNLRKKAKKEIAKRIAALKKLEARDGSFNVFMDGDYDLATTVSVLRETIRVTVSIFRHVLIFLSTPTSTNSGGFFSIPRKVIPFVSSEKSFVDLINNEVQSLDLFLGPFQDRRLRVRNNGESISRAAVAEAHVVQKKLGNLDGGCRALETGIELVLKCLVQNRVLFLNIISRTV